MKTKEKKTDDDMRPHYDIDYSKGVWGKYAGRIQKEGTNLVLLDKEVAKVFKSSEAVNEALKSLIKASGDAKRPAKRRTKNSTKATTSR